jgi:hypothetical protein
MGAKHNHEQGTYCPSDCPNRLANLARSESQRCTRCGDIYCKCVYIQGTYWVHKYNL